MDDYISRSELLDVLYEERTTLGCNGDDISSALYDMLDRIINSLKSKTKKV